jgi:hypothetical protein
MVVVWENVSAPIKTPINQKKKKKKKKSERMHRFKERGLFNESNNKELIANVKFALW